MRKATLFLSLLALSTLGLFGQTPQRTAPRPQTARQALVEIIAGGQEAQFKHLTTEVQQELSKPGGKTAAAYLGGLSGMVKGAGTDFKSFDSGSVLFAISDPKKNEKVEIQVDDDDLAGDQETFQLSLHLYQDGKEQDDEVMALSPRLSVEMKKQQDVWRVNNVMVSLNLPVGSPKLFQKLTQEKPPGAGMAAVAGGVSESKQADTAKLDGRTTLMLLAGAESMHAQQHPETGFTCSLSELVNSGKTFGQLLDPQIGSGIANGFRFNISGCQGLPAGSFQIIAEPLSPDAGSKAYCVDATQNVRFSEDGRGSTCLISGKPASAHEGTTEGNMSFYSVGVDAHQAKPEK